MPTLKIDNREVEVPAGTKVIEAAERLGIVIPRFCYHPALGSVGACRVCAVAFQEGPIKGIQMSCMVNAMDGMVVSTTDAQAVDFRKHVIEWLMLNHPHDCPVCDEGGHCLLQDLTVAGGHGLRRYRGAKRTHQDQYLGPLVQHEMNRCIQCYRCSRYYQKYSGYRDLGVMGIGTRVYFGRSASGKLESPFSGNLIDICPTGVYTDKPSRFFGRRWDFERAPAVCLHCSLGCNLVASVRYREVVRHEARPNPDVNGHFICDRGRYGYAYTNAADRPRRAMVKSQPTSISDALTVAVQRLEEVTARTGPESVAVLGSGRSSLETLVALERLCRKRSWTGPVFQCESRKAVNLKSAVGHLTADLAVSLGAVSVADTVVVIGADPVNEAPMLALSLRQASQKGGHVTVIDPRPVELPLTFEHWPVHCTELGPVISDLAAAVQQLRALTDHTPDGSGVPGGSTSPAAGLGPLAARLVRSRRVVIICGTDITTAEEIDRAAELASLLRQADTEAKLFYLLDGPNAFAAGLLAGTAGSLEQILDGIEAGRIKALIVVENDAWADSGQHGRLVQALERLDLLMVMDYTASPINAQADVFLPSQTVYETGGRWINQEGRLQQSRLVFCGGEPLTQTGRLGHPPRVFEKEFPGGAPQPACRLAAQLASAGEGDAGSKVDDFMGAVFKEIDVRWQTLGSGRVNMAELRTGAGDPESGTSLRAGAAPEKAVTLLAVDWVFGTERLSALSPALAQVTPAAAAVMHPQTAAGLGLGPSGDLAIVTASGRLDLPFNTNDRTAPGVLVVPRHHRLAWRSLGGSRLVLEPGCITAAAAPGAER
jgi:NADH-quinone oxidoreductase subunit G